METAGTPGSPAGVPLAHSAQRVKTAPQALFPFMVTVATKGKTGSTTQSPLQPAKTEPSSSARAVSRTPVPDGNEAVQVPEQEIPAGELATMPPPEPLTLTVNAYDTAGRRLKVATQLTSPAPSRTPSRQSPLPLQPANSEPGSAIAISSTRWRAGKVAWQALPQSMPAGSLITRPLPAPAVLTETWTSPPGAVSGEKVAVQLLSPSGVNWPSAQSASPDQPVKTEPSSAAAKREIVAADPKEAE